MSFSSPEHYTFVLDPVVEGAQLTKVLIDGGAGLNIIFTNKLRKMGLDIIDFLIPIDAPFYGIVPGKAVIPPGHVILPTTFGTSENYRTKYILFEVTEFDSSYDAIFWRLALTKFMVIPQYSYMLLKMPGPNRVLSLHGDLSAPMIATLTLSN